MEVSSTYLSDIAISYVQSVSMGLLNYAILCLAQRSHN